MPRRPRALLLVNPGARRALESLGEVRAHLDAFGLEVIEESSHPSADFPKLIHDHRDTIDRVIVGGGDGTLNAAVQGLVGSGLPMAVLPLGTANNLARTLGIPMSLADSCEVAAGGRRQRIDLGLVNGRYFLTTASLGLSVRITEELDGRMKRRWGPLAYAVAASRVLMQSRPFRADIVWPGGKRQSRTVQIVVGNGRYYGSAIPVAEDATIDDANLDLYSLEIGHWWELISLVPALRRGRQREKDAVAAVRAPEFQIDTIVPREINLDGEIHGTTPARFQVMPGALDVLVPAWPR